MYFHYAVDGIIGFEYKDKEYTYKKNIQGDIIGIYNPENKLICKYIYDAWGNHDIYILNESNGISSYKTVDKSNNTEYTDICNLNPFRYRGYYYDTETDLYYLNSRYYDPELGRFINADSLDNIDTENLNGFNLYMYCADNPVMYIDENGDAWWNPATWNWKKIGAIVGAVVAVVAIAAVTVATMGVAATAMAAGIGATIGAISYTASVVGTGITTGNWNWSWGDFLGSTFGGAIGGMLSIIPGLGSFGTGFVTGGLTSLVSDAFNYAIYDEKKSFLSVVLDFFVSGTIGGISSKIVSNLVKVPGINKGQGSLDQVTKQIYTKFSKGIISKISMKTLGKMFVLGLFSELPSLWLNNYKVLF